MAQSAHPRTAPVARLGAPFELRLTFPPRRSCVAVLGDVDLTTVDHLSATLSAAMNSTGDDIVLDLTGLDFISADGLQVINEVHEGLSARQRSLDIVGTPPFVARLLELVGPAGLNSDPAIPLMRSTL